jgi:hypothetical protein
MRHQTALVRREGKTQDEDLTKIVRARFNQSADLSTYPRKIFVRTTRATALTVEALLRRHANNITEQNITAACLEIL